MSGAERLTAGRPPPYDDVVPYARALIAAAPDRVLWGTDWPHPNVRHMPDDGDLVDLLADFAPDEVTRHRILVDNPARLYFAADQPHTSRHLDDEPQLGHLLVVGELVALDRGREPALRRQAQLVERHVLRRLVDAALEGVLALQLGALGGDEAEHDRLPGGTNRSGAKPPDRSSSYSRKNPSTASSPNSASATKS